MNSDFITWLVLGVLAFLAVRWLTEGRALPVTRHTLRLSVLQWLLNLRPDIQVVDATDEALHLAVQDRTCTLHLEQLARRCAEWPAKTALLVQDAVAAFIQALDDRDGLPADWAERVVVLLLPEGAADAALLRRPLCAGVQVGYALELGASFRWVRTEDVLEAGVTVEALHAMAMRNLERSCNALVIDTREGEEDSEELMLRFATSDGLDAARLLVPSFYGRFGPRFDDTPLLVAIPSRDTLLIVSAEHPGIAGWLAWRAKHEHHRQAYPLLPTPLRVTEQGIEPA
jgi:hypothetical protein